MNNYHSNSLDQFWMWFVLIHIAGSALVAVCMASVPGYLMLNTIPWVYCAYAHKEGKMALLWSAIGWSCTLFLLVHMPTAYGSSFIINLLLLTYLLYQHFGSFPFMITANHVGRCSIRDLGFILWMTCLLLVIGEYVNALSMLIFTNYVSDSVRNVGEHLWAAILVLALLPAIVEELIFRGVIFQRLGYGKKAILISALLFALGHMNFNQMTYAFVMGFFFALIYSIRKNLTITIGIHMLYNLYTILMSAYADTGFVRFLSELNLGGYHIFWDSQLRDTDGRIMLSACMIGAFISLLAILCIFLYMRYRMRRQEESAQISQPEAALSWKPGIMFYVSCIICVMVALPLG